MSNILSEVQEFKIGGYQVLDKWLKDLRKAKRSLSQPLEKDGFMLVVPTSLPNTITFKIWS
jgi:hypothetical protein